MALQRIGRTKNCWVVGRNPASAAKFAAVWKFENSTDSLGETLADPRVEVVFICSPNALHAEQARMCLNAGKHVVVEIPLAMSRDEARALVDLGSRVKRTLQVCQTMRSFDAIREMRAIHSSGRDRVTQVVGFFGIPRRNNEGFKGPRSWPDDLLWHHGGHLVDATMWALAIEEINDPHLIRGPLNPRLQMRMDLSLSFSSLEGQVVSHSLTYNTARLDWRMKFICEDGGYLFKNGDLFDDKGGIVVRGRTIRDLELQNNQLIEHILLGTASDFEATGILPGLDCLQQLQDRAENT